VCNVIRVSPQDGVSNPLGWSERSDQQISFAIAFPFVANPPTIDPVVYNTAANIEANTCDQPQTPRQQRADYVPPSAPSYPAGPSGPGSYTPPSSYDPGDDTPPSSPPGGPPALPVSWTGIYIGVHGGGTRTSSESDAYCTNGGDTSSTCGGDSFSFQQGSLDFSGVNGGGGVQAGGRAQFGILIVGVEIDLTRMEGTNSETYTSSNSEFFNETTVNQSMRWFGTTRASAGIAFGNILVFVTGGVAVADVQYGVGVDGYSTVRRSTTQVGWTGGGGFEIGLGLFSFRAEYLHFDLGDETVVSGMAGFAETVSQFDNSGDTFRFGINFRLN
jgi:outer membrane immunogenic protein